MTCRQNAFGSRACLRPLFVQSGFNLIYFALSTETMGQTDCVKLNMKSIFWFLGAQNGYSLKGTFLILDFKSISQQRLSFCVYFFGFFINANLIFIFCFLFDSSLWKSTAKSPYSEICSFTSANQKIAPNYAKKYEKFVDPVLKPVNIRHN